MSTDLASNPTVLGVAAAVATAAAVQLVKTFYARVVKRDDALVGIRLAEMADAARIRAELRIAVTELQTRIDRLQRELDDWRGKYYGLIEENATLRSRCDGLERRLGDHDGGGGDN